MDENDREKILGIYTAGILAENLLGPHQYFEVRATAHQESWVSIISLSQFLALVRQRGSIALNYARILGERLLEARQEIEAHSFMDTEHRLAKALLKLAEQHGQPVSGDQGLVKLRITLSHEHLARLVGGNRPHVSTIMSKFKQRGWIDYQGRKLLLHREALRRLVPAPSSGISSSA